jgi:hypothetical protein
LRLVNGRIFSRGMKVKSLVVLLALVALLSVTACAPSPMPTPSPTPTPTPAQDITLADAPGILDMSSDLPDRFEHVDSAREGFPRTDMQLGPEFSEVEVFLSREPSQKIIAYMRIIEAESERAATDSLLKDEKSMKSGLLWEFMEVEAAEQIAWSEIGAIHIAQHDIGDFAVSARGEAAGDGLELGIDILAFKSDKVYVFILQYYLTGEGISLVSLAEGIARRIEALRGG